MLFWILGILLLGLAGFRTFLFVRQLQRHRHRPKRYRKPGFDRLCAILYGLALLFLLIAVLVSCGTDAAPDADETTTESTTEATEPPVLFDPAPVGQTDPANWKINWEIFENDRTVTAAHRTATISFGAPEDYFSLPGICTFRGNNYRNATGYGTAQISQEQLSVLWESDTGVLPGASWSGSGWTGQPLMVQWDAQTRSAMNLYAEKKFKDGLVEVIYATLDGNIYFLDLEDGSYTRDPIYIGQCFKGSGSLDPRGYPLLYVGSGDVNAQGKRPRMYIISLIDGNILYEYGDADPLSLRHDNDTWCAFDSSPLVDAESDTLIWPGENGLLYTFQLNTRYDPEAGTLSIDPDTPVLTRYSTPRSGVKDYWFGYEASASIVENYLYISENGGMFYCVDLNTMDLMKPLKKSKK